jgi:ferredoxin
MKVEVDQIKCGTMGVCVKICPEIFRFQEGSKKAVAITGGIPEKYIAKCIEAVKKCPNEAIVMRD